MFNISTLYTKAVGPLSNIPPLSHIPLCLTLVPVITQLLYRHVRSNMYQQLPTMKQNQFEDWMKQRDDQHKLFAILAIVETVAFLALAKLNPYYLIPAGYTLAHLIWTDISKRMEGTQVTGPLSTPEFFLSMDGKRPIGK